MRNLKHNRQLKYQEERSITHNTDVLPGKHKAKNPTIIYYVYIMDHETISYKTLIQELLVQYTIVSHSHTKIGKCMCQFTASRQPASFVQSLLMEIPTMNESLLPRLHIPHGHIQCVCGFMSALTNVRNDSQTVPFTFISTGSDMHVVNSGKSSVACETTDCELIHRSLTSVSSVTTSTTKLNSLN
jgi:hypothetical protein